jgi:hypothetical protein
MVLSIFLASFANFPDRLGFWNFSQTNSVSKPPQLRRMAGTKKSNFDIIA